ncbi:MAG: S-methyl-5-thioribose-1-phosphate isomerase, partial [Gammaproteobacteria bacterium]
ADASDAALRAAAARLAASRPTAVNLRWGIDRMLGTLLSSAPGARREAAWAGAQALEAAEYLCCERIGEHGLGLLRDVAAGAAVQARGRINVLTHCNAGWLATGAWGTALAPVYRAVEAGFPLHVWVDETRPRNQGARLTAWELAEAGIPHTLIVDSAAGQLMRQGEVDLCIVGSDRTTRTGDVCNKVGTYQKALAARDNGLPFYVALPLSTIDWGISDGLRDIPIEARDAAEILWADGLSPDGSTGRLRHAAPGCAALHLAFDVTPARLVSALVCEHGVVEASEAGLAPLRAMAAGEGAGL